MANHPIRIALAAGASLSVILLTLAAAAPLSGTAGPDILAGGEGKDTIEGLAGDDLIYGDPLAGNGPVSKVERIAMPTIDVNADEGASYNPVFSADGKKMAFETRGENQKLNIVVRDLVTGAQVLIPAANSSATFPETMAPHQVFSPDGTKIVFSSSANLIAEDNNQGTDVYVVDLSAPTVFTRVSVANDGSQSETFSSSGAAIWSPDGKLIAFQSNASNLIGANADQNGQYDIFVRDLAAGATRRVSLAADGSEPALESADAVFSPDGTKIAFATSAPLVAGDTNTHRDIHIRDLVANTTIRVSDATGGIEGDENCRFPVFSPDGNQVAFESFAKNLATGDDKDAWDIFVHDIPTKTTTLVSVPNGGGPTVGGDNKRPVFSPDGSKIFFVSGANNLVANDTNGDHDVFMRDLRLGVTTRVSTKAGGGQVENAASDGQAIAVSPDGRTIAYHSAAIDLVSVDGNGLSDIFIATLAAPKGGDDVLKGGEGDDTIFGGPGNDLIMGGAGKNVLDGGPGVDTLSYADFKAPTKTKSKKGVSVNLAGASTNNDVISNFEIIVGSPLNDTLIGDDAANTIFGGKGADTINGGGGKDIIVGGRGADILRGGKGADRFVYTSVKDSPASAPDTIVDFKGSAKDRIDLSAIDAQPGVPGKQPFKFIGGKPFSGKKGELRFFKGVLSGDTKGRGRATFAIKLKGVTALKKKHLILSK